MELLLELLTTTTHKKRKRTYDSVRQGPMLPVMPSGVPAKAPHNVEGSAAQAAAKGKDGKKPKARPKKNLWFKNQNLWARDIQNEREGYKMQQDGDKNVYAVDGKGEFTYGVWYQGKGQGVTFHDPRPLHTAKPHRARLTDAG